MTAPLCLAACFLPLDDPRHCAPWTLLQAELAQRGIDLILLTASLPADPRLPYVNLPFNATGLSLPPGSTALPLHLEPSLAEALALRDHAWSGQTDRDLQASRDGLLALQHVVRTLLHRAEPAALLPWGSSLAPSVLLHQTALQQGRPSWVIERGLIPGTYMLEMTGQGGCSELNWSFATRRALQQSTSTALFDEIQARYRAAHPVDPADVARFRHRCNPDRRRLIVAALQHDAASAIEPASYLGAANHAPGIPSSRQLVAELADLIPSLPQARVLVRPHPLDTADYRRFEGPWLRVADEPDLSLLLEAADVVVCMNTTVQFHALLHEKPLVLAARSALHGKGVAHEAATAADLAPALRLALEGADRDRRSHDARRFIDFIARHFCIQVDQAPAGTPSLADLADLIASNALPMRPRLSPEALERVVAGLRQSVADICAPRPAAPAVPSVLGGLPALAAADQGDVGNEDDLVIARVGPGGTGGSESGDDPWLILPPLGPE